MNNLGVCVVAFIVGVFLTGLTNEVDVEEEDSREELPVGKTVRLVGSSDGLSGRLEVFAHGAWGTVCNTTFDYRAASVVCRQLGFTGGLDVHDVAVFGRGGEGVALSESSCVGSEPSLSDCQLRLLSEETQLQRRSLRACINHLRDVGVICQNDSDVVKGIRLTGRNNVRGRLEVYVRGKWGTVCDRGFTYSAARVACTQLGLHSVVKPILFGLDVPRGLDLDVALSNLRCSGNERFLQDCPSADPLWSFCLKDHAVGLICENDTDTIFFKAMFPHSIASPNNRTKSFLVNGEDVFHFEMSGGSGQILLVATVNGSDSFLRIVLRKFRNTATILGTSWTTVEHSLWFCQVNESTCLKNSSKLESVLSYRDWTNYTVSVASGGTVLRVGSGQLGPATTLLSARIPVSLGDSFRISLGAGQESEVIYRVRQSQDMNRCYLRDDDEEEEETSPLKKCGDAFVNSSLCSRCGCCYDPSITPHCYLPVVAPSTINEGPCLRLLSEIVGRVLVTSEKVVCVDQTMTLAIGVETYDDSIDLSVDKGNGNVSKHLQLSRATDLPGWITSRYGDLVDSLPYWTFIDVVYDRAGRYSVRASFEAYRMETYVSSAHVAIVENWKPEAYLFDDGPAYYLNDDIDLFFQVENYGAELSISFEVQDPTGSITQSLILGTLSASVPLWASKKLPNSTTEDFLANFKSTEFKIFAASIGKYVVKAVANTSCYVETVHSTIEVLPRPRLREVVGELRFIVDDSYHVNVVCFIVLVLNRMSRSPQLEANFGYGDGFSSVQVPTFRPRLPDFAVVKLSLLPQGSVSWIVLKHTFPIAGSYNVEVIYSDEKWDFLKDNLELSVEIIINCDIGFTFAGGGSAKENATVYSQGQAIRLVASLAYDCSNERAVVAWSVQRVLDGTGEERVDVVNPLIKSSGLVLLVPNFTLEYGFYVFLLRVRIRVHDNYENLTHNIWVRVEPALLKAEITQGITQVVEWLSNVTIDASKSRDPDARGQLAFANLSFMWFCLRNNKKLSDHISDEDSCFVDSSVNRTLSGPTIHFNTTQLRLIHFPSMYTFHLLVNKSHSRQARARHVLMVAAKGASRPPPASTTTATPPEDSAEDDLQYHLDVEPVIDLKCMKNCLESEYSKGELELVAVCRNCVPGEVLSYEWGLVTLEGESLAGVDWDVVSTTGNTRSYVILLTSGIESAVDRLFVTVSVQRELGESGAASFAVKVTPMTSAKAEASTSGALSLKRYDWDLHMMPIAMCSTVLFSLEMIFLAGFLPGMNLRVEL